MIEIAVVIVVLSLLLAMIAGIGTAMLGQQRREVTRQRLVGVETAIALFVSQNLRLPCPADGRLLSLGGDPNLGLERPVGGGTCAVAGANTQTHGVVPWLSLGLSEMDVTDGWGNRFTYRVAPELAWVNSMNFTYCDPAGADTTTASPPPPPLGTSGYCNSACATPFVAASCTKPSAATSGRGLAVKNVAGVNIMTPSTYPTPSTGAAYIVISHGENGEGAYNGQSTTVTSASSISSGDEEKKNFADLPLAAYFVDDFAISFPAEKHFDDFVLRPSIFGVATKAQLGPRAH